MDWSNEDYVRLYTRETDDDLVLSWHARAVWHEMMKKFDRSGLIAMRRGRRGLAALIRIPFEVVDSVIPELLEDGRVRELDTGYFAPNFMEAQEASKSDRQRQRDSRTKRRAHSMSQSGPVTNRDAAVTDCDGEPSIGNRIGQSVTFRDQTSQHHPPLVTLTSADPDPTHASLAPPRAHAIPPSTNGAPDRAEQKRRLIGTVWNYAGQKHHELKNAGIDPTAPNCWSGMPSASSEPMVDLRARIDELTDGDPPNFAGAEETIKRRIDVAFVEAKREQRLDWFTPARMWAAKSFAIASAMSPEQAARPRGARASPSAAPTEAPRRIPTAK